MTVCVFKEFYSDFTLYKGKYQYVWVGFSVLFFCVCTKKKGTLWPKSDITEEGSSELEASRPR